MHPHRQRHLLLGAFLALIALALLFGIVRCGASDGDDDRQGAKALAAKAASYKGFAGRSPLTTTDAPVVVPDPIEHVTEAIESSQSAETVPPVERPQSFTDSGFPADCIGHYESGNDYGEAGGGRFQIIRSTWAGYDGYSDAEDAPAWVQDAKAAELWSEAGHQHWAAQRGRCF